MKFPVILLTPSLTFFAFNALAQDVPAPVAPETDAAAAQPAPAAAPAPALPPPAGSPAALPELVAPLPPPPMSAAVGNDGNPMAGWHNGVFYLRDTSDNFRLYLQGRAQIDFYSYAGPGVADVASLKPTLLLRRIRPEIGGEFFHSWWFSIAGDFGVTKNDNGSGTNETSAATPGVAPTATSGKYASAQTPTVSAAPTDVFLNYRAHPLFNVQVGQFDAPFTMENRTSDKYIPFMERSLAVRDV
ncbi:MAG TPA: porin, partial [Polyangiaceae bacterium]|nr:porin [Polyangiaceae bacterium]